MYENVSVYRVLWIYWLTLLIMLVLIPFEGVVFAVIGLVVSIVQLYQVYLLRGVSDAMARAWRWMFTSIVMTLGGLVLALLAIGSVLSVPLLLLTLIGMILMLVAEYYFYAGLDELVMQRGYDYPAERIRWCFWLQLIGAIVAGLLGTVSGFFNVLVQLVTAAAVLWLLWQYLQAVKAREEA